MAISGGTYVIIQHASYLRRCGFDVTLAAQEAFSPSTIAWHDEASQLHCIPIEQAKSETFDLVIATWWKTVFELEYFDANRFAYFVQSIESRFYPEDDVPLRALVDSTYRFPLAYVTEATWIQKYLFEEYGQTTTLVRNGIRKDVYQKNGPAVAPRSMHRPRVLIEGHFGVSFKNTALALRLAREAGARDIWVLTGSPINWIPGVSRIFSQVPISQTAEIYRSCDILIKLSTVEGMFGPPLEIFHCGGTAVVYDVTGHDEYIVDGLNARVLPRGDADGVVRAISKLLSYQGELKALKSGALQTAAEWPSWEESSSEFLKWVNITLEMPPTDRAVLKSLTMYAFEDYEREEQIHIRKNPGVVRRHKLSALASRLPSSVVRTVKKIEAIGEVLLRGRETY